MISRTILSARARDIVISRYRSTFQRAELSTNLLLRKHVSGRERGWSRIFQTHKRQAVIRDVILTRDSYPSTDKRQLDRLLERDGAGIKFMRAVECRKSISARGNSSSRYYSPSMIYNSTTGLAAVFFGVTLTPKVFPFEFSIGLSVQGQRDANVRCA